MESWEKPEGSGAECERGEEVVEEMKAGVGGAERRAR